MPFCCKRFFKPNLSETIQARGLKCLYKIEKLITLEKIFKKCRSFDVAYLQLRVELHQS